MARHNVEILHSFMASSEGCEKMDEKELLDQLNLTVAAVEKDDSYSTSAKLKIFSLLTSMINCAPKERTKYRKKVARHLR